ncbi:mRNA decay activator protein ZFP36 [Tachyglossus aculeatus]|uniref:mRNA decay activator protein ZFP36 n=1 Tax=Tachyglossus aculeatus TaxID=9261 RepID=UPI0018F7C4DF|nr:mRNA decay activator protein ZFP36 [Tachyglossus aculeatus]
MSTDLSALYERFLTLNLSGSEAEGLGAASPSTPVGWGPPGPWSPGAPGAPGPLSTRAPGRSISLTEGGSPVPTLPPPPGFPPLARAAPPPAGPPAPPAPSRYKTELCRTFEESGRCKYGAKCQFAHGPAELRQLSRHPKYKTEPCHKFYLHGRCPYGARCHFIHHPAEERPSPPTPPGPPPALRHSLSYSGPVLLRASSPPAAFSSSSFSSCSTSSCSSSSPPPSGLPGGGGPVPRGATAGEACCACRRGPGAFSLFPVGGLPRTPSAHSLSSDLDCYSSSGSLSGSDSPVFDLPGGVSPAPAPSRRLPIFNRLSVSE